MKKSLNKREKTRINNNEIFTNGRTVTTTSYRMRVALFMNCSLYWFMTLTCCYGSGGVIVNLIFLIVCPTYWYLFSRVRLVVS